MESLERILREHPFFKDLKDEYLELLAGCASNVRFDEGQFVFREGQPANEFYLIRHGSVALEIYVPGRGPVMIEKVGEGEVFGWSWLFPPYRWHFDARALEMTRAIVMDGKCVRNKCDSDPVLGYQLMLKFAQIMEQRLQATRLQLIDVYGNHSK